MWSRINNDEFKTYHINFQIENDLYVFHITNFIEIWECKHLHHEIKTILEASNPFLIDDDDGFVENTLRIFFKEEPGQNYAYHVNRGDSIDLCIEIRSEHFKMKLPLKFHRTDVLTFCKYVTLPMLTKLRELQSSEEFLTSIVLNKDKEIAEYKAEGAVITIKHLITKPFDIDKHKESHTSRQYIAKDSISALTGELRRTFNLPEDVEMKTSPEKPQPCPANKNKKLKVEDFPKCTILPIKSEFTNGTIEPKDECMNVKEEMPSTSVCNRKQPKRLLNF